MRASYYDPVRAVSVEVENFTENDVLPLVKRILSLKSDIGYPAIDFVREDSSNLSLATDGRMASLVWVDPLEESFHSVGSGRNSGDLMVYDYFGSWSAALAENLIELDDAIGCIISYCRDGTVLAENFVFEPG